MILPLFASGEGTIQNPEQLRTLVNKIATHMTPLLEAQGYKMGQVLISWNDNQFQAGARIIEETNEMEMMVTGAVARAEGITRDAIELVLCHEFGHVVGGAPKTGRKMKWEHKEGFAFYGHGTYEGQADYFATLKCFRSLHGNSDNNLFVRQIQQFGIQVPKLLKQNCERSWKKSQDISLCIRAGLASENMVNSMEREKEKYFRSQNKPFSPQFASLLKSDSTTAQGIQSGHPDPQCRLDTLIQGTLCPIPANVMTDPMDANRGVCLTGTIGARPKCWFNPNTYQGFGVWQNIQKKDNEQWNGVGLIDGRCSGFLIDAKGSDDQPALVVTNGHCADKSNPPSAFVLNRFSDVPAKDHVSVGISEIVFSTMKKADVAVLRLSKTVSELKKLGFHFYGIEKTPEEPTIVISVGTPLRKVLRSSSVLTKSFCKTLKTVQIREHTWQWEAKQTNCSNVDGFSGSPLFSETSGSVIGLLNTTVELDSDSAECGLNKPCQVTESGTKLVPEVSYAQKTDVLLNCLSEQGTVRADNPDCH